MSRPRAAFPFHRATDLPADGEETLAKPRSAVMLVTVILAGLLALTGGIYFAYQTAHYSATAKPGVMIGSLSVEGYDASQLAKVVEELTAAATVDLSYEEKTVHATLDDLGVTPDVNATVAAALKAEAGSTLLSEYSGLSQVIVPITFQFNDYAMSKFLGRHFTTGLPPPTDAAVRFDQTTQAFVVVPGTDGHGFDLEPVHQAIQQLAAAPQETGSARLSLAEHTPILGDDVALAAADDANVRLRLSLKLRTDAGDSYKLSTTDIADWTQLSASLDGRRLSVGYDYDVIARSLPQVLAGKLTHDGSTGRVVTDAAGQVINTLDPGTPGVELGDLGQVADAVTNALNEKMNVDLLVPTITSAAPAITAQLTGPAPTNDKWIDVDLSAQMVTLFTGNDVVASYVVSSGMPETPTLTGTFRVYHKTQSQTMSGWNADGTRYSIPDVRWVTYYDGDYAFHAAYWLDESQIGTPQSHGCLNMREADAKYLYDWAPGGTTVVVHD